MILDALSLRFDLFRRVPLLSRGISSYLENTIFTILGRAISARTQLEVRTDPMTEEQQKKSG